MTGLGLHVTPDAHDAGSGPTRDSRPSRRWVWAYARLMTPRRQGRVSDGEGDRPLTPVKRAINKASTGMRSLRQKLQIRNRLARECLAEFFGEYMLILMGTAAVAQVVTNFDQKGTYLSINIGYAAGVLFGIYASVGVS
ncbi:hypothetical protein chiPu_0022027, partial [Chiloscyllium punctatum]|nr:hypothetical protein [Chiloscyllium punctatum]